MLYVTTRISKDAYTASRALSEDRGPSGGFYVPMRVPRFEQQQIAAMGEKPFSQNAAEILNLLFGTDLDGWAVEFGIGRYPVKLIPISGKITVAEVWHNPSWKFERLVCGIEKAIRQSDQINRQSADWVVIAARISTLFGIYGQFLQSGVVMSGQRIDVSVPVGDFTALMAAWYARDWGLPIGTIVCCDEHNSLWNLLHRGELRFQTSESEHGVPPDLERLIFAVLGREEILRYCEACRSGGTYTLQPEQAARLRDGIHISVVSSKRIRSTIPNLYHSTGFVANASTALAYSGLIDYRAASTENRQTLILSEESPRFSLQFVADCMGIPAAQLKELLD